MKNFYFMRLFLSLLLVSGSFCFTACDNDDDNVPPMPDNVSTATMYGAYSGLMNVASINPHEGEDGGEGKPSGVEIAAKVKNDTICFEDFPIKDIVLSIIPDEEMADKIVAAVGKVSYKIGYEPTLTANRDSIEFTLDPEPLKLAVTLPSETEEEAKPLIIEVKVEAEKDGGYSVENANMNFSFVAAKVLLGEGENQQELPDFKPITCNFNMDQHKADFTGF